MFLFIGGDILLVLSYSNHFDDVKCISFDIDQTITRWKNIDEFFELSLKDLGIIYSNEMKGQIFKAMHDRELIGMISMVLLNIVGVQKIMQKLLNFIIEEGMSQFKLCLKERLTILTLQKIVLKHWNIYMKNTKHWFVLRIGFIITIYFLYCFFCQ